MAQQTINLGSVADDGTGDTLRAGGDKINDNFDELYTADAANLKLSGGTLTGKIAINQTTIGSSAGAITIDLSLGNTWLVNLTEDITSITISNPPATGNSQRVVVYFKQEFEGTHDVSGWPAIVAWPESTTPVIAPLSEAAHAIVLDTFDNGTSYFGTLAAANYAVPA